MPPYKNNRQISNLIILDSHWESIENMCRDKFRWSCKLAGIKFEFYFARTINCNVISLYFHAVDTPKLTHLTQNLSLGCEMNPNVRQALKVGWQLWHERKSK